CMLPFRWREPSPLTLATRCEPSMEPLRSGIDRAYGGQDNGVWLNCGGAPACAPAVQTAGSSATYAWPAPQRLSGARIVFDSLLSFTGKRMRKLEATVERAEMPAPLARAFRIEVRTPGGEWRTVFADPENFLRLRRVAFAPVEADALRLIVESTWGGGPAHVFALDAL
ncbi:MAG: hypothetical protein IJP66_09530, partial [Kiritimatiellae bacterium]|nr:hypothetical protein [Kiritimatiellia bacterium]